MALDAASHWIQRLLLFVTVTHAHRPTQHGRLLHRVSCLLVLIGRGLGSSCRRSSPTSHEDGLLAGLLGDRSPHHGVTTVHASEAVGAPEASYLHWSALAR